MSDRFNGFYVALEEPMEMQDMKSIVDAVSCIKGVLTTYTTVETQGDNFRDSAIRLQVRLEFHKELAAIVDKVFGRQQR